PRRRSSAALRRFPKQRKTSRRLRRPAAVLIGADTAARGITGSAAATVAGAPPAEHEVSGARFARAALPCHLEREAPAQGLAVFAGRLNRHPIGSGLEIAGQARG